MISSFGKTFAAAIMALVVGGVALGIIGVATVLSAILPFVGVFCLVALVAFIAFMESVTKPQRVVTRE